MAIPRTPVTIDTSDTFNTWLTNTNHAIDILKNIVTDTILTHASGAYTASEILSQGSAILTHDDPSPVFVAGRTLTGEISGATAIVHSSPAPATGATTVSYTSVASLIGDSVVAGTTANSTAFVVGEVINQATTNAVGVVTGIQGNAATTGNGAGKISYTTTSGTFTGNSTITGATSSTTIGTSLTYTTGEVVTESTSSNTAILATVGAPTVNATGIAKVVGATTTNVVTTSGAFNTNFTVAGATSNIKKIPSAVTASHLATTNAALTTPTLTTPTIASNMVVNGNTLTLPTSTTTLVGTNTTDNLTNKTLTGATITGGSMSGIAITNNAISSAPTISVDDGGTIGTDTDADAITIAAAGAVTFSQRDVHTLGITVANGQTIGSASDADAITIASAGAVTFSQRDVHTLGITVADGQTIGSATDADAITIASAGAVTFSQRDVHTLGITVANGQTIGSASDADAITIASAGAVTFSQRSVHSAGITVADAGQIGSATDPDAIAIGADGDVTLTQDLELQHDLATISMGANDDVVITHIADEGISLETTPTGTNAGTIIHFKNKRTTIADGEMIARLLFQTPSESDGSDAIVSTAEIGVKAIEAFSATANRSAVTFGFADGGTTITEALRIVPEGIKFPASVNLSADANTLDDYEEGTFTPTLDSYNYTPTTIEGRYTKIGRMVFAVVAFNPYGTSADYSEFLLESLPFTAVNEQAPGIVTIGTSESYNYDNDYNPQYFFILKNTVQVKGWDVSGGVIEYLGRAREISGGNEIILGIQYETAS